MNALEINQTFDLLALAEQDTQLKRSGRWYIGPCPFCGGQDRFNLQQAGAGWRWFCRKCGDGKYHGAIDYIMRRENLPFVEALRKLGGDLSDLPARPPQPPRPPEINLPPEAWQRAAALAVLAAADRLLIHPGAQQARDFLRRRGFPPVTWQCWLLGFDLVYDAQRQRRPAILIPYLDNGLVIAVKYRFIDDLAAQDKNRRYGQRKGSAGYLFGLWDYLPAHRQTALLVVEGELNALSIWQQRLAGYLVVSLGGDTISPAQKLLLSVLLGKFSQAVFWMDDPIKAQSLADLRPQALVLRSPKIDGLKYDANQLLQEGLLSDFLKKVIPAAPEYLRKPTGSP